MTYLALDLYYNIKETHKVAHYDLLRETQCIRDLGYNFDIIFDSSHICEVRQTKSDCFEMSKNYEILFKFDTDAPDEYLEIVFWLLLDKYKSIATPTRPTSLGRGWPWYPSHYTTFPQPPSDWNELRTSFFAIEVWHGNVDYDDYDGEDKEYEREEFNNLPPLTLLE